MSYSAAHPERNLQIQRITWFMRFLSEEMYIPSYDLVPEDIRLLEDICPGSSKVIEDQKEKVLLMQRVSKFVDVLLDKTIPYEVKGVLRQLSSLGYNVNNPPPNLRVANEIVAETLRIIVAMKPKGVMEDYSEYTILPGDIAVKTEHPGGASRTVLTLANSTPEVKTMDFKQYALQLAVTAKGLELEA